MDAAQRCSSSSSSCDLVADVPPHLTCPISKDIFERPVTIDGHTFDEAHLLEWLTRSPTCPLTRKPLNLNPEAPLKLNEEVLEQVQAWKRENEHRPGDPHVSHRMTVPAGDTATTTSSPGALVDSLSRATRQHHRIALLQRLQEVAWHSEVAKMQIAHGIPVLLDLILPTTGSKMHMEVQWHAAEVLSLLAMVDQLRDNIIDQIVPPSDSDDNAGNLHRRHQLEASLHTHLHTLMHAQDTNPRGLWILWLLSLDAGLRSQALCNPLLVHTLANTIRRKAGAASFAALRVVRSLALVDGGTALHVGGVVTAALALLANTNLGAPTCSTRAVAKQRIVAMAACSALCNATSGRNGAPTDVTTCTAALKSMQAMLRATDSPHVQGWAARCIRVVGATWANGWQLCKEVGVVAPLLHMLRGSLDMTRVTACSALHALTEAAPQARADMARDGAVAILAAAVHSHHYPLRFMAARTMAELACPAASGAFHCQDVATALEQLLQDGCEHCQYCATVCLLNTSIPANASASCLVLQHVDAATLRGLLHLLSSSSAHYRCAAAAVLRHLVRVEANRPIMVKVGAVHALLDVVVRDAGRCPLEAAGALQHLARMGPFYRNAVMDAAQEAGKLPREMLLGGLVGQLYTSRSS